MCLAFLIWVAATLASRHEDHRTNIAICKGLMEQQFKAKRLTAEEVGPAMVSCLKQYE